MAATRQTSANRDTSGLRVWQPGESGNTRDANPSYRGMLRLCRVKSREAVETLLACMRDEGAPWPARVVAANSILDRAWGKAKETVQLDGADQVTSITLQIVRPNTDAEQAPMQSTPPVIIDGNAEPDGRDDEAQDDTFSIRIAKPAEWD